jgi:hypothetical protein
MLLESIPFPGKVSTGLSAPRTARIALCPKKVTGQNYDNFVMSALAI